MYIFNIFDNGYVLISSYRKKNPFPRTTIKLEIYQIWTLQGFLQEPAGSIEEPLSELGYSALGPPSDSEFSVGEERNGKKQTQLCFSLPVFQPAYINSICEMFKQLIGK